MKRMNQAKWTVAVALLGAGLLAGIGCDNDLAGQLVTLSGDYLGGVVTVTVVDVVVVTPTVVVVVTPPVVVVVDTPVILVVVVMVVDVVVGIAGHAPGAS